MTVPVEDGPESRDDDAAAGLVGSTVLIGLTYASPDGDRHDQVFGTVMAAGPAGIEVRLDGRRAGDLFNLPPDLTVFSPAAPGTYRLKSTGEQVIDPDYLCTWTIHPPGCAA